MHVLRASDRAETPWKNGGGVTHEVASEPSGADLASFDWRLSIAHVATSGPFSAFPGVDRILTVLTGRLALSAPGQIGHLATPRTAPWSFPGDDAVWAMPIRGGVDDLNLMCRRGRFEGQVDRLMPGRRHRLVAGEDLLLAVVQDPYDCVCGASTTDLRPLDAIWLDPGALAELRPQTPASRAITVRIRRTSITTQPGSPTLHLAPRGTP
jgi:environmental stress-induced protein Ves